LWQSGVLLAGVQTKMGSPMPSQRYYRDRARTLLAWSRATKDKAYAAQLRLRAANELEQAEQARAAVAGLNALPGEFHARQMQTED
jgi:hypothetical protein